MTPHFKLFLLLVLAGCLAGLANAQTVTSTRIESASWTCRDAAGAVLSSHERQDKAQEACTNRALAEPGVQFEIRPSGFRIVAVVEASDPDAATLSWTPPTKNEDGSALTDLAGYRIHYGPSAAMLHEVVQVASPSATTHKLTGLAPGTYYFGIKAFTSTGVESALSNVASKVVQ